jgi:hypothetical protein
MPKPYELSKAMAPHSGLLGASLGAGIGGLSGLLSDPGYDEETGDRKSRFRAVLKGLTGGGLIGGAAGAAAPFAAEGYGRNLAGPVQSLLDGGEDKEAKAAVMYSIEKVASYRKNQSAARVKMASAVLHLDAINRELDSYNLYDLRKSAAIGVRRAERMKVAALIRQRELEKRAFAKAIMEKRGKGKLKGIVQPLMKGLGGLKDYAFGAAQGAGAAAKKQYNLAAETGSGVKGTIEALRRPQAGMGADLRRAAGAAPLPNSQIRSTALKDFGGALSDSVRAMPQGAKKGARQAMRGRQQPQVKLQTPGGAMPQRRSLQSLVPPSAQSNKNAPFDPVAAWKKLRTEGHPTAKLPIKGNTPTPGLVGAGRGAAATGLGTLAALTQLPGHGSGQGAGGAAAGVPQRISGMMQNLPRPGFSPGLGGPAGSPPTAAPQRQGLYDNPNSVPSKKTDAMMTSMIRNWPKDQAARQVASDGPAAPPMPTGPARPVPAPALTDKLWEDFQTRTKAGPAAPPMPTGPARPVPVPPLETPSGDPGMTGPGGYPLRLPGRPDQPPKPTAY